MAILFDDVNKQILIGDVNKSNLFIIKCTPLGIDKKTPESAPQNWKVEGGELIEMTSEEKTALADSRKRFKNYREVMLEIKNSSASDFDALLDALDSNPSFGLCLELGDMPTALHRLNEAKVKNSLTEGQHNRIKSIIETKV